jgi:hypothetical protein
MHRNAELFDCHVLSCWWYSFFHLSGHVVVRFTSTGWEIVEYAKIPSGGQPQPTFFLAILASFRPATHCQS